MQIRCAFIRQIYINFEEIVLVVYEFIEIKTNFSYDWLDLLKVFFPRG